MSTPDIAALAAKLERRFRTATTEFEVAGRRITLMHPASADELISEEDFAEDERLPYWADVWPSAIVLARLVGRVEGAGRPLLELGCGAGLVATAAAQAGFAVTATDYYEDATRFARVNASANAGVTIAARMVDWRVLPDDLGRFEAVVASDVLYERPYGELVARVFDATLAEGGTGWLTDPGRVGREGFVAMCDELGMRLETVDREEFEYPGAVRKQKIDVFRIRRGRGS
ncbi:MAG: class I SAM-dependent methyltransferase [Gemmatimonadaceae bacterium]